jgi:hypothetical protein
VVIEITPPMASEPHSELCGPASTSMRWTFEASRLEKSKPPAGADGSFTGTPSTNTTVLSPEAPRKRTVETPPEGPVFADRHTGNLGQKLGHEGRAAALDLKVGHHIGVGRDG